MDLLQNFFAYLIIFYRFRNHLASLQLTVGQFADIVKSVQKSGTPNAGVHKMGSPPLGREALAFAAFFWTRLGAL